VAPGTLRLLVAAAFGSAPCKALASPIGIRSFISMLFMCLIKVLYSQAKPGGCSSVFPQVMRIDPACFRCRIRREMTQVITAFSGMETTQEARNLLNQGGLSTSGQRKDK
jgi:hypothetical protein